MGRLKNHLIGLEDEFWNIAQKTVSECEQVEDFVSEMSEHSHLVPLISDESEFTEMLVDAWNNYWHEKGNI